MNLQKRRATALFGAAFLLASTAANATVYDASDQPGVQQAFSVSIVVDENGNGRLTNTAGANVALPFALQNDPGPGGLANVLTYSLVNPPGLTAGDVLFSGEPGLVFGGDVVRFNPNQRCVDGSTGCLVFYSDNIPTADSIGDTSGPPLALYPNTITVPETGPEGNNFAVYTPLPGQPGFVAGAAGPVTYTLISDAPVPEPSSLAILAVGLAGAGLVRRQFRRRAS
jgi:hypothetical protein